MTITIDVDDAGWNVLPALEELSREAISAVFAELSMDETLYDASVLFSGDEAVRVLNAQWRGKDYATNVLSFPADDMPVPDGEPRPLGDIILASGVVANEAAEQGKPLRDHVIHLIIHGVLHLLGHDHEDDAEATEMEGLETRILKGLGISDPYE